LEGQHLEEKIIAGALGGVACAGFLGAKDTPSNACFIQELSESTSHTLRSIVKAGRTPHPIQNLGLLALTYPGR
jgi:hypothetical protein